MGKVELLEKGALVHVQCAFGRMAENVVWEDHGDVVMVCGKGQFDRLNNGYEAPMPIGFRRSDVIAATLGVTDATTDQR